MLVTTQQSQSQIYAGVGGKANRGDEMRWVNPNPSHVGWDVLEITCYAPSFLDPPSHHLLPHQYRVGGNRRTYAGLHQNGLAVFFPMRQLTGLFVEAKTFAIAPSWSGDPESGD